MTPSPLTCHPFNEDVDMALKLCGSQTADNVGMVNPPKHGHLLMKPPQFLLLLGVRVAHIANLKGRWQAMRHCIRWCCSDWEHYW